MTWKGFDVDAYNARLASLTRKPYAVAAKEARTAAREIPALLESDVLPAVLEALRIHPRVAWVDRMNVGGHEVDGRYIRFGLPGMADITGQMKDGRRLEVEVKRPGGKPTLEQVAYLALINRHHGVAFVATGVDDVMRELG